MQQVTIRGIDPEVEKEIRKMARENGKSINQVIKEIIHKEFKGRSDPASSLKKLAGGWDNDQAAEFYRAIESCEKIDKEPPRPWKPGLNS